MSGELLQKVKDRLNGIAFSFLGPIFFRGARLSGGALPARVGIVISGGNVKRGARANSGSFALHRRHGVFEAVSDGPCNLMEGEPPGAGAEPSFPRKLAACVASRIDLAAGEPRARGRQSPPGRLRARTMRSLYALR